MTAGGHKKFLFDTDFGTAETDHSVPPEAAPPVDTDEAENPPEETEEDLPPPPSFSEEDVAQARAEGYQAGRDDAARDAASALEQHLADTVDAINAQVAQLLEAYVLDREEHNRDAVAVAAVIVRKLFPTMNADAAVTEIEHMVAEAMKRTSGAHALMVRVAPDLQSDIDAKVQGMAAQRGRETTVTVTADATLPPGDARVEWDGGGMVRDTAAMWRDIDEIIERNLGERTETNARDAVTPSPAPRPTETNAPDAEHDA